MTSTSGASRTAILVCMGRAIAHGTTSVPRFNDPTALTLLLEEAGARVNRIRSGPSPKGIRGWLERVHLPRLSYAMAVRTVAIDDAICSAAAPQVVILGAGLVGRAWRMPWLADAVVFEVDTPVTQADKRARVGDPTWVWAGVVMYLTATDVESTLANIERRSATGSGLIVAYHRPALLVRILAPMLRRMGEPLRSAFTADEMRAMLRAHGFAVARDETLSTIGSAIPGEAGKAARHLKHFAIALAARGA